MNKSNIKFGDNLTYSDEWFRAYGRARPKKIIRLLATGRITGEAPDYIVSVIKENTSYVLQYHHSFLEKLKDECQEKIEGILDGIENPYQGDSIASGWVHIEKHQKKAFEEAIQAVRQSLKEMK